MTLLKADSHPGLRRRTVFCHFPVFRPVRPCWLFPAIPLLFQQRPSLWWGRPIGSTFVIWQMSTGSSDQARLIFMCVQSQDFNLVKGCGIYFPKCCPNSVLLFFSCLLGLRWLLNALNYAGSLCIFEHLCVIQIMGGHRAWLTKQLLFRNGKIPRSLTMHCVWGGWGEI